MHRIALRDTTHPLNKGILASFTSHKVSNRYTPDQFQRHRHLSLAAQPAPNQVVFSGIQPTGVPHLGNYLGALREWVKLQDSAPDNTRLIFSIVDLHAVTVPQKREQLREWKRQTLAALLAIGLDPSRSTIFYQSAVCVS
jgi:tryptophanyl-tRNA synthetase